MLHRVAKQIPTLRSIVF